MPKGHAKDNTVFVYFSAAMIKRSLSPDGTHTVNYLFFCASFEQAWGGREMAARNQKPYSPGEYMGL